jgi:hypothetical protein
VCLGYPTAASEEVSEVIPVEFLCIKILKGFADTKKQALGAAMLSFYTEERPTI